jgi:ribonuclease BN (tRNA processing enzyme)
MRLTVLGGCGAWPGAGQACSGYLVEHGRFRLLIDPGYATLPRLLLTVADATEVDAVLVSHGHPDHCADLNPLLRARVFRDDPALVPLPVYAPAGALGPVLALDRPGALDDAIALREFTPGDRLTVGPFGVRSWPLPHFMPNAGLRLEAGGRSLAYTGDTGPSPLLTELADGADVYLAEATYPWRVPPDSERYLSSGRLAGAVAREAGVGRLLLTHLQPGTEPAEAVRAAAGSFPGEIAVASAGLVAEAGPRGE